MKRTRADRRRAALAGWQTRRANERKRSAAAKRGWQTRRKNQAAATPSGKRGGLQPAKRGKGVKPRRKPAKKRGRVREKRVPAAPPKTREYFVVLTFTTRKRGRTVTRRLYEAIVTLPDGATEDEVLKAYQEKIQEQHPKLHNREIERLLFGENRGRRIKIVPRDSPGSEVPSGSVRVNDARNPTKRKSAKGRKRKGKKA